MTTVINIVCLVLYVVATFAMERYFARIRNRTLDARDACLRAEWRLELSQFRLVETISVHEQPKRIVRGAPEQKRTS